MVQTEQKTARIDARLPESVLELLRRAASIQGRSSSDFIVASARDAAERAIRDHELISLSAADQQLFAETILNPPPVSDALVRASKLHAERIDSE